jgi:hypothetical protein
MAGLDKVEINATTAGDSKQLFDNLFMASWLSARKALVVTMSGYQLLQELGRVALRMITMQLDLDFTGSLTSRFP